jgi:hypothetical protein
VTDVILPVSRLVVRELRNGTVPNGEVRPLSVIQTVREPALAVCTAMASDSKLPAANGGVPVPEPLTSQVPTPLAGVFVLEKL